jgi:hypothetical protein
MVVIALQLRGPLVERREQDYLKSLSPVVSTVAWLFTYFPLGRSEVTLA